MRFEVHDSGPGLSEQARASLFQPTISFKKRGMGLGLSIARKSALLSGGDIVLVKGELGGAGFRVLLPSGQPMATKRILIVDDEENIGRSLRMILEREGYSVNAVQERGGVSPSIPPRSTADVYLFDVRLPDGSGIDLLRALKQNDNGGRPPS